MFLLHQNDDEVHDGDLCELIQVFEVGKHLTNRLSCQGFSKGYWADGYIDGKFKQTHVNDFVTAVMLH